MGIQSQIQMVWKIILNFWSLDLHKLIYSNVAANEVDLSWLVVCQRLAFWFAFYLKLQQNVQQDMRGIFKSGFGFVFGEIMMVSADY